METGNGSNGHGDLPEEAVPDLEALPAPPGEVAELVEACVLYVERDTKVPLDFTPETLPLLDHWVRLRRTELVSATQDEFLALVAAPAGAYLGEVARRVLRLSWFTPPGDYRRWRIELENVFLSTNPIGAVVESLLLQEAEGWGAGFRMRPEDEAYAKEILEIIPEVEEDEYYAPSSRLETLEIVADRLIRRTLDRGDPLPKYTAADYGPIRAESIAAGMTGAS
jgi:hypothetical protein